MSIKLVIDAISKLRDKDYRVLNAVERGMASHMYVPMEVISKLSGIELKEIGSVLKRLNTMGLVQRKKGAYTGFILTSRGYDCLALRVLRLRGVLELISASPIGVGKESDVYLGLTSAGKKVAVKIHRVGRISFRQTRRVRSYIGERRHISWLYQSRLAAKNEYEALQVLNPAGVSVPQPIDWNRHIVVTEYYEGTELFKVPDLENPMEVKNKIIREVLKAYENGIIHGDLSEYNILVNYEGNIVIFDWPQWISSSHPSALMYLKRDLKNIINFFMRKYHIKTNITFEIERFLENISTS